MKQFLESMEGLRETVEKFEKNDLCFVIAPIGDPGTDTRRRSDQVFKHLIGPAASACGYQAIRADHISEQGIIATQVIQHLIESAMVVADLTDRNPNVFYELAIRHAIRRPYAQIIQKGQAIPFDVAGVRTLEVDYRDLDSVAEAKERLIDVMRSMEGLEQVDSPVSTAVGLAMLSNIVDFNNEVREMNMRLKDIYHALLPSPHP